MKTYTEDEVINAVLAYPQGNTSCKNDFLKTMGIQSQTIIITDKAIFLSDSSVETMNANSQAWMRSQYPKLTFRFEAGYAVTITGPKEEIQRNLIIDNLNNKYYEFRNARSIIRAV